MSGKEPVRFTAESRIFEALMLGPEVRDVFRRLGLRCVHARERGLETDYCVAAEKETLADAARYHDVDLQKILDALNALRARPLSPEEQDRGGR